MQPSQPQEDEAEPEELVRFRQAWLRELEQANARRRPEPDHDQATIPASASQPSYTGEEQLPEPSHHTTAGELTVSSLQPARVFTQGSTVAVDNYRRAVECERQSQLDDALRLYRQAFRMDPNVDKAFHSAEQLQQSAAAPLSGHGPRHKKSDSTDPAAVNNLTRRFGALSVKHTGAGRSVVTGTLASLLDKFPQELIFEPEDEKSGVPISSLPDEILVLILRSLDPTGIERFAAVSRKARVVSLDSGIWRYGAHHPIIQACKFDWIAFIYIQRVRRNYLQTSANTSWLSPRNRSRRIYVGLPTCLHRASTVAARWCLHCSLPLRVRASM
jgi:F-box protein 9